MARPRSALRPGAFVPTWEVFFSVGMHVFALSALLVGEQCSRPEAPMIDPSKVMRVTTVLPKSIGLPDKAMRTPDPVQGSNSTAPLPPPTASDMRLHDEAAPEAAGTKTEDRSQDREALLRKLRRDELLKDMSAPIGPEDHSNSSPDGVEGAAPVVGPGGNANIDPVLGRWVSAVQAYIRANWKVLPTVMEQHRGESVQVAVFIADDGTLTRPKIIKGTGDEAFDSSALRAVVLTGKVPPPPEAYRDTVGTQGVILNLTPQAQ